MYSDVIKINKNFQTSVNLELDLNNENKINEYIPTSDICDVLKKYINAIVQQNGDKATTLVGPYGKGKSFLLLVLAYIISQNSSSKAYVKLLKRIKKIDNELFALIQSFNESGKKLLPIIINSNYDNLNQAFMLALNDALKREGISDIIPETAYSVCLSLINEWKKDDEHMARVLARCEEKLKTSLDKIEMGLKNYSADSYNSFVELYNCVTHGMPFNPLVNNDIVHIYSEVVYEISKQGFSGAFIIFDEFSKFLESAGSSTSKDLKIIQDFAETASRSSAEEQLHICCVTHKSFSLYKSTDKTDSFKTVEGRFKEVKFNRSLDENYQIISAAIKNEDAAEIINSYINSHNDFYESLGSFEPFNRDINKKELYNGCFPLNPVTVYSLIQLSELVAQNERTLFTFISDTDDNSFNSFLHSNNDGLFNVDKIYDYFSPLLKREEGNEIRNVWYRTEGTLSRIADNDSRRIIKALAVILMIDDVDNFPSNVDNLALATMLPKEVVAGKINNLIENHYLRQNVINNLISFASSSNKAIEDQVNSIAQTNIGSISYDSILDEINESRYILPRRYNEQNKITRFYKVLFITEDQFNSLSSFDIFRERDFSDGIVLNLIRTSMTEKAIKERFRKFSDLDVILKYPGHFVKNLLFDELLRYVSLQELQFRGGNDDVITNEIDLLLQETIEDIRKLTDDSFNNDYRFLSNQIKESKSFNDLLSDQMSLIYTKRIVFNNELINKNTITSAYQKAANNVIEDLLNKKNTEYSETSPETTIRKSVIYKMDQPDVIDVKDSIKQAIISAEKKPLRINDLVDRYTKTPYGIRRGVFPLILAQCINELSDNILLYLKNKEIDLTANNLVKAVNTENEYYFKSSKGTMGQANYMIDMLCVFGKKPSGNFRLDTKVLCEEYRKFFIGLPMIIKNIDLDNQIGISNEIINFKKCFMSFSLNPYEVVFSEPLRIYGSKSYKAFKKEIIPFVQGWENSLVQYKGMIIKALKNHYSIPFDTSLRMGINDLIKAKLDNSKPVLSESDSSLLKTIESLSFDDVEAVNQLCISALNVHIEDWIGDRTDGLITRLDLFFNALSESKKINTSTVSIDNLLNGISYSEPSAMGKLFQNNLESVLDEFGESVTTEEKIAILTSMLKKYL